MGIVGRLVGIYLADEAAAPVRACAEAEAIVGVGLAGDRYALRRGTYSATTGTGREVTLIAAEALEVIAAKLSLSLDAGAARRNLVTRGVDLSALVGHRFRVGEVVLEGMRDCAPCVHLERLTRPGVMAGLAGRGGLRAEIRRGDVLRVGDAVTPLGPAPPP